MIIINCARAHDTKWGEGNKHFLDVGGETLIERTVRQFKEHGQVTINARQTRGYDCANRINIIDQPDFPLSGWIYGIPEWDFMYTLVVLGDVYFTDNAVQTICNHPLADWTLFGRSGASSLTHKNYGEPFALKFRSTFHDRLIKTFVDVVVDYSHGILDNCNIWNVYRRLLGLPDNEHVVTDHFYEIDDGTDDIDYPADYAKLKERLGL